MPDWPKKRASMKGCHTTPITSTAQFTKTAVRIPVWSRNIGKSSDLVGNRWVRGPCFTRADLWSRGALSLFLFVDFKKMRKCPVNKYQSIIPPQKKRRPTPAWNLLMTLVLSGRWAMAWRAQPPKKRTFTGSIPGERKRSIPKKNGLLCVPSSCVQGCIPLRTRDLIASVVVEFFEGGAQGTKGFDLSRGWSWEKLRLVLRCPWYWM